MPQEYVETMRASLLNKCPVSSYDDVCEVFQKELGKMPNEVRALCWLLLLMPANVDALFTAVRF